MSKVFAGLALWCLAFSVSSAFGQSPGGRRAPVTDRAHLGVRLRSTPGSPAGGPVRIHYVLPGSTAESMGVRSGDEVREINGKPVPDRKTMLDALSSKAIGDALELKVLRGAETLTLRGTLGSYEKTRRAILEKYRKDLSGKPLSPVCSIEWSAGTDGLQALRGKIGVVVVFDGCQECVGRKWQKVVGMKEKFANLKSGLDWIAFAGVYSNIDETHAGNLEALKRVLARFPSDLPVGVARYPGDEAPADSQPRDALFHDHGIAILDPQGNVLYVDLVSPDLDAPGGEFSKAFQDAWSRFGPKGKSEVGK